MDTRSLERGASPLHLVDDSGTPRAAAGLLAPIGRQGQTIFLAITKGRLRGAGYRLQGHASRRASLARPAAPVWRFSG